MVTKKRNVRTKYTKPTSHNLIALSTDDLNNIRVVVKEEVTPHLEAINLQLEVINLRLEKIEKWVPV
jgi:hypothetical protein